ncbi:F-box protein At3g07870-like [Carya illinoinensis]|uniref:F-box protein At3g07870-like n=1 Tax=Carya illinoinensis TaxID=32201 RepID=UPI001C71B7D3|nr:F-box protein At3g07870-like [Carya illinoinensis]
MESLPPELILNIVSGLPVSFLVQFKSICKGWRMLLQNPDLVNMHSTRMRESNPCLIFHCDYLIRNQLYFVELPACIDKKEKVKKLHVPFSVTMPEFDVVGSCNVYCNYEILEIWVLKKYGVGESWNKKFCIGNYVPIGLEKDEDQYFEILKITSKRRFVNSSFMPLEDRR